MYPPGCLFSLSKSKFMSSVLNDKMSDSHAPHFNKDLSSININTK